MSNEDVEKQPVPIADAAMPVANNKDGGECKVIQLCYSPIYYYIKIGVSVFSCVSAALLYNKYSTNCAEGLKNDMVVKAWFVSMIILWAIQAGVHLVFIVTRFITKHPPSNILYSGKYEGMLRVPLMIELIILIVVAVVGVILIHAADNEGTECDEEFSKVRRFAYMYIVLALLMVIRFGKAPASEADALERQ